ncbi:zinc metalloprotease [Abyssalbus ytuae]|uniref:Zinc metalloprotease n=1 Tax=Abyssalbus ytuae TaxID=2926907 RepID=A0A9E6ZKL7_9FLAO|nr:zinc metalloprotease [Abyssalbus ytuae]UOB15920.1 zinc metalloprotease [Abyssalbus ytuae]
MKKVILSMAVLAMLMFSCEKSDPVNGEENNLNSENQETFSIAKDHCGTMGVLSEKMSEDPTLEVKMQAIEQFTQQAIKSGLTKRIASDGVLEIPVVFHVIYRTSSENIPNSQLQDQLDILNEDFNMNNPGRNTIPGEFTPVEANIGVRFVLQDVIRKYNSKRRWNPDDRMKFTSQGGSDVVNPQEYLNIWIVNNMPYQGGNILGYAQFPGGSWSTDGVVLDYRVTGYTAWGFTGRTATHEVGHWMNLRHIWGDGGCGASDFVADTPDSDGPSSGCPIYPQVNCGTNDMTMNFMDYSNDECMNMFTLGQKDRMMAVFANGGFREQMAQ